MEWITSLLAVATTVLLLVTLFFATKALKEKDDRNAKKENLRNAGIFFVVYVLLNVLRLAVENNLL